MVDYSSDHLEAQDVWGVPAGGSKGFLEAFPGPGPVDTGPSGYGAERPVTDFSPSEFLTFSPHRLPLVDSEVFNGLQEDLLGSSSWPEAGGFFTSQLGFQVPYFEEGF